MSISSIEITNLLSFEKVKVDNFKDINCIVGMNNAGKSNFLKIILYFYDKLNNKRTLPPSLNNSYTPYGSIAITYDMSEIKTIVTRKSNKDKSNIFPAIFKTFFSDNSLLNIVHNIKNKNLEPTTNDTSTYKLILYIHKNESTEWSTNNRDVMKFINYLYPFFYINTRNIDLHNWSYIWDMISRIKTYKTKKILKDNFRKFIDKEMNEENKENNYKYSRDINKIENIIKRYNLSLSNFSYNEKIINFIKAGLTGHEFNLNGEDIDIQSDGTNSSNYLQIFIALLISLSRREYIIPALYIDEPEIGLHPKKSEELITNIYELYSELRERKSKKQYPHILFSTHSPNVLKIIIKLFEEEQQVLHFSKKMNSINGNTLINKLKSTYTNKDEIKFLNRFSDNEARLFFSKFILFVEGETEVELFSNKKLMKYFKKLNEIDIYPSADSVKIRNINPSSSNTSIPYYILYDMDKFVKIEDNILRLKNSSFNFKERIIHSKREFPDNLIIKKKMQSKRFLLKYITNSKKFQFNINIKNRIFIDSLNFDEKHKIRNYSVPNDFKTYCSLLKEYLKLERIFVNKTTIENAIINTSNINLFLDWIFYELKIYTTLKRPREMKKLESENSRVALKKYKKLVSYKYSKYKSDKIKDRNQLFNYIKNKKNYPNKVKQYKTSRLRINPLRDSIRVYNDFFIYSKEEIKNNLSKGELTFFNEIKESSINKIKVDLLALKSEIGVETFTYYVIALFNGKTETLKTKNNIKSNDKLNPTLNRIERNLCCFKYFTDDKTSNWITNFLNYYFERLEDEANKKNKENQRRFVINNFKKDFKELYDIINTISLELAG